MTITKQKKVSEVYKKIVETATIKDGPNHVICAITSTQDHDSDNESILDHINNDRSPAIALREPKHKGCSLKSCDDKAVNCCITNTLRTKSDDGKLRCRLDDNAHAKPVNLSKTAKSTSACGVQANVGLSVGRLSGCAVDDRLEHLKNRHINFVRLAEDDFAQQTASFRSMRDAMIHSFQQNISLMNEQYERRKTALNRSTEQSREAIYNCQYPMRY